MPIIFGAALAILAGTAVIIQIAVRNDDVLSGRFFKRSDNE
jgi:hypothetical protein